MLLSILLAACTSGSQPTVVVFPTSLSTVQVSTPATSTATAPPPKVVQIPDLDKFSPSVEVVFWYPWSGDAADSVADLVSSFNLSNPWNVKIIAIQKGDADYLARQIISPSNEEIRPMLIAADIDFLRSLSVHENGILDLFPYINHPKWGIPMQEQLLYPITFWKQDMVGETHFGLPAERNAYVLFYNQTWAKELGFKAAPSTPDEFLNQSCAAARQNSFDKDLSNNGTGGWIFNSQPSTILSWLKAFDGGEMPVSETESYQLQTSTNEKAFTFLQQMMRLGCGWFSKDQDPYQYFAERKALFYSGSIEDITRQETIDMKDEWKLIPYPSTRENEIILADGISFGIFQSDADHDLAAWLFIRWMQKPENQAKFILSTSSLPFTSDVREIVDRQGKVNVAWGGFQKYLPQVKTMPLVESWPVAGRVLQDAAWQVVQSNIKPGEIISILQNADLLIKELLNR